jgi:hypothetical protein
MPIEPSDFDDPAFIEQLWDAFYPRMKLAVLSRVRSIQRPVADGSGIALSAFHSFIQHARNGKFPNLVDQDEMWRLVKQIAIRKTSDVRKNLLAQKRGGGAIVYGQSDFSDDSGHLQGINLASDKHGEPSEPVEVADLLNALLQRLPDDRHRDVILLKLQGASVVTIAECLGTTTRTIQRILKKIERSWHSVLFEDS